MASFQEIKQKGKSFAEISGGQQGVPALATQPEPTLKEKGASFATGFAKRELETLQNIGKGTMNVLTFGLARGAVSKTGIPESAFNREDKFEKAGAFTQDLAQFLLPAGKIVKAGKDVQAITKGAGKLARAAGFGGRVATEAAGFGAIGSAQEGEFDKGTTVIAGLIPVGGALLSRVARGAGRLGFGVKGVSALEARFADPEGVSSFLKTARRQEGGATLDDVVDLLKSSIKQVRNNVRTNYEEGLKQLPTEGVKLTTQGAKAKLTTSLKKFNVKVDSKAKTFDFLESPFGRSEERVLKEAFNIIQKWEDVTPIGINNLARKLGNLRVVGDTGGKKELNLVIDSMRRSLRSYLGERVPQAINLNAGYAKGQNFLSKLELNIEGKSDLNVDQASSKLFQLAKDLDNPFKREGAEKLLFELEQQTGVPFIKMLRALATAETLSPQASLGFRSGVIREVVRLLEVGTSEVAGVAGKAKQISERTGIKVPEGTGKAAIIKTLGEE